MGDKEKHMCKFKDLVKEDFEAYKRLVKEPHFACLKCGRVAREKRHLCKPVSLDA
jgi:hypothetical protein